MRIHQYNLRIFSFFFMVLAFILSLILGRYSLSIERVISVFLRLFHLVKEQDPIADAIVLQARLPRLIAAFLVGAALSCGGATYQAVFRNPLVSPDLLGVLSGAAFGAAIMIVKGEHLIGVEIGAFGGGILAVGSGLLIARLVPEGGILTLLMGGLIANAIFTALLSIIKYLADPQDQLPEIINWLLGSLSQVRWDEIRLLVLPILGVIFVLIKKASLLDVLALEDDEARSLGLSVGKVRFFFIALATLGCSLTISMAGMIGWVGLLAPHVARMLTGGEHRQMMPVCAMLGAGGVMMADTFSRCLTAGEIPLGIITELLGSTAFIAVLYQHRKTIG
ncbi:FecCD family ABC transporter permease [Swingsia samuiensis]|uniref:Iron ABC transporter permease n=1 Tax=Swingsia samuiensis TaxID=1293412 RepID=A0A4Y6UGB3_9PROT|nr:iron ABC transporter permease [Swingsia samuiensis]QDH16612.1 iron ABC transporter permease [Swingsia samuiensis]